MLFRAVLATLIAIPIFAWILPTPRAETALHYSTMPSMPIVEVMEKPVRVVPNPDYKNAKQLSPIQLKRVLKDAGFKGESLKTAWGIAMRESSGRPKAHNGNVNTGDNSYGLFQINMHQDLGPSRRAKFELARNEDLFDPKVNASIAFKMSGRGKDFGAWAIGRNSYREDKSHELHKWLVSYPR